MKKSVLSAGLLSLFMSMALVSAGPIDGLRTALQWIGEIMYILLEFTAGAILGEQFIGGGVGWNGLSAIGPIVAAKLLLFLLVLLVVGQVLKRNNGLITNDPKVNTILTWVVSILAIRFLPPEFIDAILIPYSALAVGITVFLPLAIYFFFIHQTNTGPFGRRIGWLVFGVAYLALWWSRDSLSETVNWIYGVGLAFVIISLLFDKRLHRYFGLSDFRRWKKTANEREAERIRERIRIIRGNIAAEVEDPKKAGDKIRSLEKRLGDIS